MDYSVKNWRDSYVSLGDARETTPSKTVSTAEALKFQSVLDNSGKDEKLETGVHDGHLTLEEALYHWRTGNGEPVTVNANQLEVHQVADFNQDGWAKGVVQGGNDFLVHGRVSLMKTADGVNIKSEQFDFDKRRDGSTIRNLDTQLGKLVAGEGTAYTIHFTGSPNIIRDGFTYGQ